MRPMTAASEGVSEAPKYWGGVSSGGENVYSNTPLTRNGQMPKAMRCWTKAGSGRDLVMTSAIIRAVGMYVTVMSPCCTCLRTKCSVRRRCRVRLRNCGSRARAVAPWLSPKSSIGSPNPCASLDKSCNRWIASFEACDRPRYSASVKEAVTRSCSLNNQETAPDARTKVYPMVEREVEGHAPQSPPVESAHTATTSACDLGAYKAPFELEQLICACGGEPETREHFLQGVGETRISDTEV